MLNKPKNNDGLAEDLIVAWKYCEANEKYREDLTERIKHLESLLDRYDIIHSDIVISTGKPQEYDCNTFDARKAWIYSDKIEKENKKLEKVLDKLNSLLSDYGRRHPEIIYDSGII